MLKLTALMMNNIMGAIAAVDQLGSDTGEAKKVILFKNDFDPGVATLLGDLTLADFDGYAAKNLAEGVGLVGVDPLSLNREVVVKQAAGGLIWTLSGVTNLPQTIFGFAIVNKDADTLYAAERFENPLELIDGSEIVTVDKLAVEFAADAFN